MNIIIMKIKHHKIIETMFPFTTTVRMKSKLMPLNGQNISGGVYFRIPGVKCKKRNQELR